MLERGLTWYEWQELYSDKLRTPFSITFAFVATHNHFIIDRGDKVFNRSAPVIKLPPGSSEGDHLTLLGLLNSSTACFWMKQIFHNKGSTVDEQGARQRTAPFEDFYEHDGTKLKQFPIPQSRPLELACALDQLAQRLQSLLPSSLAQRAVPNPADWQRAKQEAELTRSKMIALQEDLDWQCYQCYGLLDEALILPQDETPPIKLGERAFEIVMARRMAAGELQTTWFERHGSTPITEIPAHWPESYRQLVARRIETIEADHNIRLIEQPEYKRRWNTEAWEAQAERALREWLLNRLEEARYWPKVELTSVGRLADVAREDREFMQVAGMYRGRGDFDLRALVAELVKSEAVPFLPVLRYKESGLRKREQWERVWELQRREDEIDARVKLSAKHPQHLTEEQAIKLKAEEVGDIPVPPKYQSKDFREQSYWRLRGKLDVPKERFISYPRCEREVDPSLVVSWAGWDHLQQAQALANYYTTAKERDGWSVARLTPLLAGLLELLPWLMQWHNALDPQFTVSPGDFFKGFIEEEARALGLKIDEIKAWTPGD